MANRKPTQCEKVKEYLKEFGSITQMQALNDLGIMRLASRISELRERGENISGEFVKVKNRYGELCEIKRYFYARHNKAGAA